MKPGVNENVCQDVPLMLRLFLITEMQGKYFGTRLGYTGKLPNTQLCVVY